MTAVTRAVDSGVITEAGQTHTKPFHLVKAVLPSGTIYLSEGPAVTFNGTTIGSGDSYLEGRVCVDGLAWSGEAGQTCRIRIYNEANYAADLFLANQFAEASFTIWFVYKKADGSYTVPVKYIVGGCESCQLTYEEVTLEVTPSAFRSKFVPNVYFQDAGFEHLPAEGSVVFWNNSQYVLQRAY